MRTLLITLIACFAFSEAQVRKRDQFKVIYEWKTINFNWTTDTAEQEAVASSKYIKENVYISGIKYYNDKLYLSLPRMKMGVPATLAWIPAISGNDTSPRLRPFPNWAMNEEGDCKNFQSVQSMEIDKNGLMWVIDNGRISNKANSSCPPTLTLIDLKDEKNSFTIYTFPESVASSKSYLTDLVIDDTAGGYAYITDNSDVDSGIIVFSKGENRSWKLRESNSMRAAQNAIKITVNGTTLDTPTNIDGIALSPRYALADRKIDRNVFYCPLSSYRLYSVPTSVLRDEKMCAQPPQVIIQYVRDVGIKPSQTEGMIMDDAGVLYYGLIGNYSIAQWDSGTDFALTQQIIAKDTNYIQWVDRFAFDDKGNLNVVVNRLNNFVAGSVNPEMINYRILQSHIGAKSYLYSLDEEAFKKTLPPIVNNQNSRAGQKSASASASVIPQWITLITVVIAAAFIR